MLETFRYLDHTNPVIYNKKATDTMRTLIDSTPGRSYVHIDMNINGQVQKVVIELFDEYAKDTCHNFKALCTGMFTNKKGEKLSYVGCEFHRVVKGMYVQGGDLYQNGISKLYFLMYL